MSYPKPRTEIGTTTTPVAGITWTPVAGPIRCDSCGHDHWGWKSSRDWLLAPQWTWCDQLDCGCRTLRAQPEERSEQ